MPKVRPPGFPDGAWEFPARLVEKAKRRGWFQSDIAEAAEVKQGTVSRWLNYKVQQPDLVAVRKLEKKLGVSVGSLLKDPEDGITTPRDAVLEQLESWAARLGVHDSVVATLTDERLGAAMKQFSPQVRGAILGLVHLHRVPLPRAIDIAKQVVREHGRVPRGREPNELYWFSLFVPEAGKKESGEFPSSSHIKIVD